MSRHIGAVPSLAGIKRKSNGSKKPRGLTGTKGVIIGTKMDDVSLADYQTSEQLGWNPESKLRDGQAGYTSDDTEGDASRQLAQATASSVPATEAPDLAWSGGSSTCTPQKPQAQQSSHSNRLSLQNPAEPRALLSCLVMTSCQLSQKRHRKHPNFRSSRPKTFSDLPFMP